MEYARIISFSGARVSEATVVAEERHSMTTKTAAHIHVGPNSVEPSECPHYDGTSGVTYCDDECLKCFRTVALPKDW